MFSKFHKLKYFGTLVSKITLVSLTFFEQIRKLYNHSEDKIVAERNFNFIPRNVLQQSSNTMFFLKNSSSKFYYQILFFRNLEFSDKHKGII